MQGAGGRTNITGYLLPGYVHKICLFWTIFIDVPNCISGARYLCNTQCVFIEAKTPLWSGVRWRHAHLQRSSAHGPHTLASGHHHRQCGCGHGLASENCRVTNWILE